MLQLPTWPASAHINKAQLWLLPVGRRARPRALCPRQGRRSGRAQPLAPRPGPRSRQRCCRGGLAPHPLLPQLQLLAEVLGLGSAQRLLPRGGSPGKGPGAQQAGTPRAGGPVPPLLAGRLRRCWAGAGHGRSLSPVPAGPRGTEGGHPAPRAGSGVSPALPPS